MSLVESGSQKRDAQESPPGLIKKTIDLLANGNSKESLALLKNAKEDIIEISFKTAVPTLLINFGQPSRNTILPSYLLNKVRRL